MKIGIVLPFIALVPAIVLLFTLANELIVVDRCLDNGGSFNYNTSECDSYASHPNIPFTKRHPSLLVTGISSVVLATGLAIFTIKNNKSSRHKGSKNKDVI